jgi:hypothetical protein
MEQALDALRKALDLAQRRRREPIRPALHYPIYPAPRVAVVGAELDGPRGVRCLKDWTAKDLARMRPQALAGWWNDVAEVARCVLAGELELPDLQFPLLVFSRADSAPLPPRCHDLLWEWFRVPTLEQIRSTDGQLLAYECAARDGFHLAQGADPELLSLARSAHRCPCGNPAPLYRVEEPLRAAAG